MANLSENKGRRLRLALNRFAAMLVEEARDISGLTNAKLDEHLGFCEGQCQRYSAYPPTKKTRAPQADEIQNLENLVARLLKRPAHVVLIENNAKLNHLGLPGAIVGAPDIGLDLRAADETDYQLGYDGDWPTYRRLKYSRPINGVRAFDLYRWQWGCLWDQGLLPEPWTRETQGIPANSAIEPFLEDMVSTWKQSKKRDEMIIEVGIRIFADADSDLFGQVFSGINADILERLRRLDEQSLKCFYYVLLEKAAGILPEYRSNLQ